MRAGDALQEAVKDALGGLGMGVYDGPPVRASVPYAIVDAGLEVDWGHKGGQGREVRLAVTIHDKGERPSRPRRLMARAGEAVSAIDGELGGWRLVSLRFLRSRLVAQTARQGTGPHWTGVVEFRARMIAPD